MGTVTVPENATEALAQLRNSMRYLAGLDPLGMPAGLRELVLDGLEQSDAIAAAARGRVLAVFDGQQDSQGFGYKNARALMVHGHQIARAAADAHLADAGIARDWPLLTAALAEGDVISRSYVQALRKDLAKVPEEHRARAEEIVVQAARDGADLRMLVQIVAEILARVAPPDPDEDEGTLADRFVKLETTMDGAGLLRAGLSPLCAAMFQAMVDSLNGRTGPDDHRSQEVRDHDALQEGLRRLLAAGCLPQRNGQPVRALVRIDFAQLCQLQGAPALIQAWMAGILARRAAYLAGNTVSRGDGGTWLAGEEIPDALADAMIIPVVTADPDPAALDQLIRLCVEYGKVRDTAPAADAHGCDGEASAAEAAEVAAQARLAQVLAMLEHGILAQVIAVVSGEGGLASLLRRQLAGKGLNGPSLPLDVGQTDTVPVHLRRLVTLRDQKCAWPGGCDQPARNTEPHHITHRADGGRTSLDNLGLSCWWHHHIILHKHRWTYQLNPDGTTQATTPAGQTIHSHSPPRRWKPQPG